MGRGTEKAGWGEGGEGRPCRARAYRILMMLGFPVSACAAATAAAMPPRLSLPSVTVCVCQPYASYRFNTSSVNDSDVSPALRVWMRRRHVASDSGSECATNAKQRRCP